jgi:CRISPR-associated protein (TIGR03986 family)
MSTGDSGRAPGPAGFVNPYNFVPAPPRAARGPLADAGSESPQDLVGHDRHLPDRWNGVLQVRLAVVTPLLLPDAARAVGSADGHRRYPVRVDASGDPLLAVTAVKGMLRAAYEAVTNSRLGVLSSHDQPVAFRQVTAAATEVVPVQIVQEGGMLRARRLRAAAVRCYDDVKPDPYESFRHGQRVRAWLSQDGRKVKKMVRSGGPGPGSAPGQAVEGWFVRTNRTLAAKRNERLFYASGGRPRTLPFDEGVAEGWTALIADYRREHAKALKDRAGQGRRPEQYWGSGESFVGAIPRHAYDPDAQTLRAADGDQPGTLAWARLGGTPQKVVALFPAMISRELHPRRPAELVPDYVRPAARLADLSPADRVFGTTLQAGLTRLGRIALESAPGGRAITRIPGGLPLAVLSSPKKQQGRFYLARDEAGTPVPDGVPKEEAGYRDGNRVRGRKVYVHHQSFEPDQARRDATDGQNCTVEGWVHPGTVFAFSLSFMNLSEVELGALLWLLSEAVPHHRLGLGKPLGFGSVRLTWSPEESALVDGRALTAWYADLEAVAPAARDRLPDFVEAFKRATREAYQQPSFEMAPHIAAFLAASHGDPGWRVHYPRPGPTADEESFRWFVENERVSKGKKTPMAGRGRSLPPLTGPDPMLPYWK